MAKSFGLKQLPDESNNHSIKERKGTFASSSAKTNKPTASNEYIDNSFFFLLTFDLSFREKEDDEISQPPPPPPSLPSNSLFNRLPMSNGFKPRPRFRNFSHISEFGNGLEITTKSHKKRDKVDEFLAKKRERNTSKRIFGRKTTFD